MRNDAVALHCAYIMKILSHSDTLCGTLKIVPVALDEMKRVWWLKVSEMFCSNKNTVILKRFFEIEPNESAFHYELIY